MSSLHGFDELSAWLDQIAVQRVSQPDTEALRDSLLHVLPQLTPQRAATATSLILDGASDEARVSFAMAWNADPRLSDDQRRAVLCAALPLEPPPVQVNERRISDRLTQLDVRTRPQLDMPGIAVQFRAMIPKECDESEQTFVLYRHTGHALGSVFEDAARQIVLDNECRPATALDTAVRRVAEARCAAVFDSMNKGVAAMAMVHCEQGD